MPEVTFHIYDDYDHHYIVKGETPLYWVLHQALMQSCEWNSKVYVERQSTKLGRTIVDVSICTIDGTV